MNLLDFLFFYWRVYAPEGFYLRELFLLSAIIGLVLTVARHRLAPARMRILLPVIWLFFAGLIMACTMFMVLGGPPLWLALWWGDRAFCRQRRDMAVFRLRGAVRDHT